MADGRSPVKTYRTSLKLLKMAVTAEQIAEAFKDAMSGMKTVDLGPAAMIEYFKGDGTGPSVRDFFAQVENAAILGGWQPQFTC